MPTSARFLLRQILLPLCLACGLSGCIGAIVGAAVDVGVEVVKIPFKVGKGVYDVVTDDDKDEEQAAKNKK